MRTICSPTYTIRKVFVSILFELKVDFSIWNAALRQALDTWPRPSPSKTLKFGTKDLGMLDKKPWICLESLETLNLAKHVLLGDVKHTRFKSRVSNVKRPLERLHSEVMDPLIDGICLLFIDELSRKACIRVMWSRAQVTATTMELMKEDHRRIEATLVNPSKGVQRQNRNFFDRRESPARLLSDTFPWDTEQNYRWQNLLNAHRRTPVFKALTSRCPICCLFLQQSITFFLPRTLPKQSLWRTIFHLQDLHLWQHPWVYSPKNFWTNSKNAQARDCLWVLIPQGTRFWSKKEHNMLASEEVEKMAHRASWNMKTKVSIPLQQSQIREPATLLRNGQNNGENPTIPRAWASCLSDWCRKTTWTQEFWEIFSIESVKCLNDERAGKLRQQEHLKTVKNDWNIRPNPTNMEISPASRGDFLPEEIIERKGSISLVGEKIILRPILILARWLVPPHSNSTWMPFVSMDFFKKRYTWTSLWIRWWDLWRVASMVSVRQSDFRLSSSLKSLGCSVFPKESCIFMKPGMILFTCRRYHWFGSIRRIQDQGFRETNLHCGNSHPTPQGWSSVFAVPSSKDRPNRQGIQFHKGLLFYAPMEANMTLRNLQEEEDITFDPLLEVSCTLLPGPRRT